MTGKVVSKEPSKFQLRTALIVPFVLQIVAAVGLVGYLSFRNAQLSAHNLARQMRMDVAAHLNRVLTDYFKIAHQLTSLNVNALRLNQLNFQNKEAVEQHFVKQLQVFPMFDENFVGTPDGTMIYVGKRSDGRFIASTTVQFPRRAVYELNSAGQRTKLESVNTFDPRTRPWYQAAVANRDRTWSEVYQSRTAKSFGVSAAEPYYDQSGNLVAVFSNFIALAGISEFLSTLKISPTGQVFIVDREGALVATSTGESSLRPVGDGKFELIKAVESQNDLTRGTAQYLQNQFRHFTQVQDLHDLTFELQGDRQSVLLQPYSDGKGLMFWMVVVMPEQDFMGEINRSRNNTMLLCLAALGVAIAFGILTARWITRPILQISQASNELAQGNLDQHVTPSAISEIDLLAESFNGMASQLQASFNALQQSEAKNRAILDTIPDLMICARGDGTYLEIVGHDRLRRVYGVKRFSTGSTVRESLPPDLAELRMHHIQKALATGELQIYEHQITIDQHTQDEEVRIFVLGDDEVLIMVRDITDRKQAEAALRIAEENYRSIFENALEGIFQSSPEGRFMNVNPALAKLYGYESPAEMMNSITDIGEQLYVDPEKRAEFMELLDRQESVKNFEYRCYCKDGGIIWTQIDARAVKNSSGQVLYYEGIVQDITDRKRREDELRRQLEELKIEIDQQKREQEVAQLTESSYFQEVQQEMATINLDEFWS